MESSTSSSSKRARKPGNGAQVPSCLVDGCTADLSNCRDYHRRHKVCELHSKTPTVTIKGQEQRFCQQCSRFHSLVEFDEGKRSCRKRLDGHNRRRRKPPQPDSLSINPGRFFPNHQGTEFTPFEVTSAWAEVVKANSDAILQNHHHPSSEIQFSNRSFFQGEKQFPFLVANSSSSFYNGGGGSGQQAFSDGLNREINSSRALSLLSSPPPPQAETQTSIPNLNCSGLGVEGEPMGSSLLSDDGSSSANLHGHEMFQIGPDGSSTTSGTHHTLSFSWE